MQAVAAAISEPPSSAARPDILRGSDPSNIILHLQHDVGKWCTEYSWSAEDGMWGFKLLHNFGRLGQENGERPTGVKRVDEEEPVEGGLKGRLSAGAEFYFSAKERSAGGQFAYSYVRSLLNVSSFNWYSVQHSA